MSGQRYILEPEAALRATLDGFLSRLAADLGAQEFSRGVTALMLGGGYGRGEGGVFRVTESGRASLYNDLEFFVFVRNRAIGARLAAWCHRWERDGSAELGIDVEFKVLAADVFVAAEPTMFYFDLLQGHRLVWGDGAWLATVPARLRDPARIPLTEATRLLFNRGSGLLFARWRLEEDPEDADGFVERNHAKARLALADAVLAASGRHDGSCLRRAERIAQGGFPAPADFWQLQAWHVEGVRFKLRPRHRHPGAAVLRAENAALSAAWLQTFLWLESRRLGGSMNSGSDYCDLRERLFPATSRLINVLLRVRDRRRSGEALPAWADYPRGALQRALVAAHVPVLGERRAAECIGQPCDAWRGAYRRWWSRYN